MKYELPAPDWAETIYAERRAKRYLEKNKVNRRNQSRRITAFVQRLLAGSYLIFGWACILALRVGSR